MAPLRQKLRSGDIVEIQTSPAHHPSRDWLQLAKSPRARQKIKHWLNVHQRERAIEIGRKLIEKEARKYRIALKNQSEAELTVWPAKTDWPSPTIFWPPSATASIRPTASWRAYFPPMLLLGCQLTEPDKDPTGGFTSVIRRVFGTESSAITVKGHDDLLVYRARCCNPIRGEEIVGYVTRGKGVAVHSKTCPNVTNLMYEPERQIAVQWGKDAASPNWQPVIR